MLISCTAQMHIQPTQPPSNGSVFNIGHPSLTWTEGSFDIFQYTSPSNTPDCTLLIIRNTATQENKFFARSKNTDTPFNQEDGHHCFTKWQHQ